MKTMEREIVVIGAGPAGLCAAIEARRAGAEVLLIDENSRPGGQLFKQIHQFFGSADHYAGARGFDIARRLCLDAQSLGAEIWLKTVAYGCFTQSVGLARGNENYLVRTKKIILAAGGGENVAAFPGSTLPGVMCAGAAQTFANIHRTLPGKRIVMLGSGNVGLIVAYQLLQAGAEIVSLVERAGHIGGFGIHAARIRRAGVPILIRHTVGRALGKDCLEAVELIGLDEKGNPSEGTGKTLEADLLCLALGISPLTELAWQMGADFDYRPELGGFVPIHDGNMETNVKGFYVAGDVTGVDEATIAMEEGKLAGIAAAESLGYLSAERAERMKRMAAGAIARLGFGCGGDEDKPPKRKRIAELGQCAVKEGGRIWLKE